MTGPEHYREAEERLRASDWQRQKGELDSAMHEAAVAQVHATLAQAAATALTALDAWFGLDEEATEWMGAVQKPAPPQEAAR